MRITCVFKILKYLFFHKTLSSDYSLESSFLMIDHWIGFGEEIKKFVKNVLVKLVYLKPC